MQDIDGLHAVLEGTVYPPETEETIDKCPNEWPLYEELLLAPFRILWDSISAEHPFADNPWVWVYEFKRLETPAGANQ